MSGNGNGELEKKRAEVLGSPSKKKNTNFLVMALTLGLVLVGAYLFLGREPSQQGAASPAQSVAAAPATAERVHDPADLADGKARYFDYDSAEGLKIRYFLVRAKDGSIHSAFDACDSCWPAGKGYSQDGDEMICNNCRMHFKVDKVGEVKGGCNPSPLKTTLREGKLVVASADLEAGKALFDHRK